MRIAILLIAAVSLLFSAPVGASVVTVTPVTNMPTGVQGIVENQLTNGWSIVTNYYGVGEISPSVPSLAEANNGLNSDPFGQGIDFGRGTFYAACSYVGQGGEGPENNTPSTVWLGLDQFGNRPGGLAGIKLNQIKTLKYFTYVSKNPTRQQDGSDPNDWDSAKSGWLFPSQPIMLQFTVGCSDLPPWLNNTMYTRLQLVYRPWLDTNNPVKGDPKYEDGLGVWLEYAIVENGSGNGTGYWMWHPVGGPSAAAVAIQDWNHLLTQNYHLDFGSGMVYDTTLGQCQLLPTTTDYIRDGETYKTASGYKSPGWGEFTVPTGWVNTTGTGKTLNFVLGARRSVIKWPGQTTTSNWARFESIGARAQMDYFTLGIDLNNDGDDNDPGEKYTYNFEPAADDQRPTIAYMSQKDANRSSPRTDRILTNRQEVNKYTHLFKVAGRVTATGHLNYAPWFELDDGSKLANKVRVYYFERLDSSSPSYPPFPPNVGEFWEAWGFLELPRWPWTIGEPTNIIPNVLWSTPFNCRRLL